jgi:hypothetical protein
MDEEVLFKTVYIAQKLGRFQVSLTAGAKVAAVELATADADEWWDQLQEFRGTVSQFVEIESIAVLSVRRRMEVGGDDCPVPGCKDQKRHAHPQLRCELCGAEGLAENMTTERHTCKLDCFQQEPWRAEAKE